MVWRKTCAMEERMHFVMAAVENEEAFAGLCRRFGVSRKTGYKWLERYRDGGVEGLKDRSRAPSHHPQAVPDQTARRCVRVRRAHATWGPVKVYRTGPGEAIRSWSPGQSWSSGPSARHARNSSVNSSRASGVKSSAARLPVVAMVTRICSR